MSSVGPSGTGPILPGRPRRLHPLGQLLDLALGGVEPFDTEAVELFAPLPERDCLVEWGLAALQPLDDSLEFLLGFLERHGSTVAPKSPSESSTRTRFPEATAVTERTISAFFRTIA